MSDVEQRLREELGLVKTDTVWVDAWNLSTPPRATADRIRPP